MVKPRETTWNDVKTELLQFDRTGLLGLLKDLYALRPENRAFLAARFGIGSDPLTPFKKVISRWIYLGPLGLTSRLPDAACQSRMQRRACRR